MPIQLLLDWSKALVAIVCSLLLAISFIMCTAKPIAFGNSNDLPANRSHSLKRNAIESENPLISSSTDAMPLNISLSHNPFGLNRLKNGTNAVEWQTNATAQPRKMNDRPSKKIDGVSVGMAYKVSTAIHSLNASNELNLVAVQKDDQQDNFKRHKSLAKTQTNTLLTGQPVDTTNTPNIIMHEQNATANFTATHNSVAQLSGKKIAHSTKSPNIQTTHQSTTITTKATIQSVFLDYLTNFNGTKSQHIDSIIHNDNFNHDMATQDDTILSRTERSVQIASNKRKILRNDTSNAERIERSANFSLTKPTKRIQILIKGRFLQMLSDGTVNGTQDDQSEHTIFQRTTVDVGQIRLIGIATCLYLCMDSCGNLYSSREFTNDCIFNERLENNYNYYTSTHHSTALRTYYMALNRLGVPRKTHLPSNKPLGKLSTYVKAFTLAVPEPRSEAIIGKRFGFNHVKHGIKHLCESGKQLMELTTKQLVYPECNGGSINSNLSKKQPNHHIRHANIGHSRRPAPAPLIERGSNKKNAATGVKSGNCNTEQCLKRRKISSSGNRNGGNANNNNNSNNSNNNNHNGNKKNVKKINPKTTKKPTKKAPVITSTTTTTTTTTTTESAILNSPKAVHDVPDNYEDDLDYSSGSMQFASNGQTGLASDEDYENDK